MRNVVENLLPRNNYTYPLASTMAELIGIALAGIFGVGFVFGMWVVLFRRELAPIDRSRAVYGHAYEEILPRSRLRKARRSQIETEPEEETLTSITSLPEFSIISINNPVLPGHNSSGPLPLYNVRSLAKVN